MGRENPIEPPTEITRPFAAYHAGLISNKLRNGLIGWYFPNYQNRKHGNIHHQRTELFRLIQLLAGYMRIKRILFLTLKTMHLWCKHFNSIIISEKGYVLICSIIASYLTVYTIVQSKYDSKTTYANTQLSNFFSMTSGNNASTTAILPSLSKIQNITTPVDPALFNPISWFETTRPNREIISDWASVYFKMCSNDTCGNERYRLSLNGADYHNSFLPNVDFSYGNMHSIDLSFSYLKNSTFSHADLRSAKFNGSNLNHVKIEYSDLEGSDFRNTMMINITMSHIKYSSSLFLPEGFSKNVMQAAQIINCDFSDVNFDYVDLSDTVVSPGSTLQWDDLIGGEYGTAITGIHNSNFSNASLVGANLSNAIVTNTTFENADLRDANLSFYDHRGVSFKNATYNKKTKLPLPESLRPEAYGLVLSENHPANKKFVWDANAPHN